MQARLPRTKRSTSQRQTQTTQPKYIRLPPCPNSIDPCHLLSIRTNNPRRCRNTHFERHLLLVEHRGAVQQPPQWEIGKKNSRIHLRIVQITPPNISILPVQHGESQGPAYRPVGRCRRPRPTIASQEIYNRLIGNHQTSLVSKREFSSYSNKTGRNINKEGTDENDRTTRDAGNILVSG
jgi:hypothetical protein